MNRILGEFLKKVLNFQTISSSLRRLQCPILLAALNTKKALHSGWKWVSECTASQWPQGTSFACAAGLAAKNQRAAESHKATVGLAEAPCRSVPTGLSQSEWEQHLVPLRWPEYKGGWRILNFNRCDRGSVVMWWEAFILKQSMMKIFRMTSCLGLRVLVKEITEHECGKILTINVFVGLGTYRKLGICLKIWN